MDYLKIYNNLVSSRKSRGLRKDKFPNEYFEKHHIIPKSRGGNNTSDNLVLLTMKEHIIAHRLLALIYPNDSGMKLALTRMLTKEINENGKKVKKQMSTREAAEVRKLYSEASKGKNNPRYKAKVSDETRDLIRKKALGNKRCVGRIVSEETRELQRQKALNRGPRSPESLKKTSEKTIGGNNPQAKTVQGPDGNIFPSTREASEFYGIPRSRLWKDCKNERNGFKYLK